MYCTVTYIKSQKCPYSGAQQWDIKCPYLNITRIAIIIIIITTRACGARLGLQIWLGETTKPFVHTSIPTFKPYLTTKPSKLPTFHSNLLTFQPSSLPTFQPFSLPAFQPSNIPAFQLSNLLTFQPFPKVSRNSRNNLNKESVKKQEKRQNPFNTESV